MAGKRKLLIISQAQFGYHTPNFYYSKYLKNDFDITYLSWDFNKQKIHLDKIKNIYVSRKGNIFRRSIRFIRTVTKEIKTNEPIAFLTYFKGITAIIKILNKKNLFILDIRTGSVKKHKLTRIFFDLLMKVESKLFNNIAVLSESLAEKMNFNSNLHILPLGAEVISSTQKTFDKINLLYVGTLWNRRIEESVKGFSKFYHIHKKIFPMKYTIIGSGRGDEEKIIKNVIREENVSGVVSVLGELPHGELSHYFDSHNVGVSYIPITDYYKCQPAIKTFEYLLAGMPVIATATNENKKVIMGMNGIIVEDNSESFHNGLEKIYLNRDKYNSDQIRNSSQEYSWTKIINNLKTYIEQLCEN